MSSAYSGQGDSKPTTAEKLRNFIEANLAPADSTDYEDMNLMRDAANELIEAEATITTLEAKLEKYETALSKLARLGNGKLLGNSDGNMIAREAILEDKL